MSDSYEDMLGYKLMLGFKGMEVPQEIVEWIENRPVGGFTLFRPLNVESPAQLRRLTDQLKRLSAENNRLPLLIAADQEGGQLQALGEDTTIFPGHMALGATRDLDLAYQMGAIIGKELRAVGVNLNYGPVCDINTNPNNPYVGVRSFSDDATVVSEMSVALVKGLQDAGVAATLKHFPGNGDTNSDPHYGVPIVNHTLEQLKQREMKPFVAAIDAGAKLVMSGHASIPSITGRTDLPATLSRKIMYRLLRKKLKFDGVVVSDAFDMGAITQGAGQVIDSIAALRAGVDLLLLTHDREARELVYDGIQQAHIRGLLGKSRVTRSADRINALKHWVDGFEQPDLDVVQCPEHEAVAKTIAERAVTLVRNSAELLPLSLPLETKIAVIVPKLEDLTPADTSSYLPHTLADAIREHHPYVDQFILPQSPTEADVAEMVEKSAEYDLLIVGTISANIQPAQAVLTNQLLATQTPTITVALRTPYDLVAYPDAATHICTYSVHPVTMTALANAMFGKIPFLGQLPVVIPDLYPRWHSIQLEPHSEPLEPVLS